MRAIIQTSKLSKIYGSGEIEVTALDQFDITINQGEFIAIMGPSGSGKSTLMNILGCLDRPTTGQYLLDREDVSRLDKVALAGIRNRQIGFIFQSFNLLPRTSALDNVILPLIYRRPNSLSKAERNEKGEAVLELVGLADRMHHEPMELSGGQRQRVAIARALVNDPVLIMADEPTGNLDSRTSEEIMQILHQLHGRGRTIVVVTHESEVADQTERVLNLRDGRLESDNRKQDLAEEREYHVNA